MSEIIGVFGINGKLLVIQAVNFGILLLVLWHFLYKPVIKMLNERQGVIEQGVKDAEEAGNKLQAVADEKASMLTAATKDGDTIVEKAVEQARVKEGELIKEAQLKSERVISEAGEKAEEIKKQAFEESKREIARTAILTAEKILKNQGTK